MLSFSELLAQGAAHAWLFIPSAILLGALHGLEPGHSKTMMAAFIVAIRGTVWQAVLLGLTATVSHTLVVWGIGLGGGWWLTFAPPTPLDVLAGERSGAAGFWIAGIGSVLVAAFGLAAILLAEWRRQRLSRPSPPAASPAHRPAAR